MEAPTDSPADPAPGTSAASPLDEETTSSVVPSADEAASAGDPLSVSHDEPVDPDAVGDFTDPPPGYPDLTPAVDQDGDDTDDPDPAPVPVEEPGEQDPASVGVEPDVSAGQTGEQVEEQDEADA